MDSKKNMFPFVHSFTCPNIKQVVAAAKFSRPQEDTMRISKYQGNSARLSTKAEQSIPHSGGEGGKADIHRLRALLGSA